MIPKGFIEVDNIRINIAYIKAYFYDEDKDRTFITMIDNNFGGAKYIGAQYDLPIKGEEIDKMIEEQRIK